MSEESFAYTPGLAAYKSTIVRKIRSLPIKGEILVKRGDLVDFDTIVGRSFLEGAPYIVKVSELLGLDPEETSRYLHVKIGDKVKKGDIIAKYTAFMGLLKRIVEAPTDGIIESINELTGHVTIREPPRVFELKAFIRGRVADVVEGESVTIETFGGYIQGILGFGGERHGVLELIVSRPDEVVDENKINESHAGKIIVGGAMITYEALIKALKIGVRGVVVGGAKITDIEKILGYRIGVAITGRENINATIILTEGFGKLAMSQRVFEILKENEGREAAINGATQVRAGVIRPEIIIPHKEPEAVETKEVLGEGRMRIGSIVRIIRYPYFGAIGRVIELPIELNNIETESPVRIVKVLLENGRIITVPRANVEIISE
ncbi:MAG: hypothetical protein ACP5GI_05310 [Sulfolobales archaeon]